VAKGKFVVKMYPSGRVAAVIRPQVERRGLLPRVRAVESAARTLAPKRTGRLARSIRTRARGAGGRFTTLGGTTIASYEIVVAVPYAAYVSGGTKPHIIRVRNARVLTDGVRFFGTSVRHPGTRPNNYLERALRVGFLRG